MALLAQRAFWRGLLRDTLQLNDILTSFKSMEAAEQVALSVYKRVLERYPQARMAGGSLCVLSSALAIDRSPACAQASAVETCSEPWF
jgi:hypothetical protein